METVLVTGGAGYIGSHTVLELLKANYNVIVVDNLYNSKETSLERVQKLAGKKCKFFKTDLVNKTELLTIFKSHPEINAVIHFAGLKAVGESTQIPLEYYQNNVTGTLVLCQVMKETRVKNLVFSSSATVYGDPHTVPIKEDFPLRATNPYGRTKLIIEWILRDLHQADNRWNIALLRYFNPIGAHESGDIGEDPNGIPNNLLPYISQVAVGKLNELAVFGNDYPTIDGTGVRDYIHVMDLALGHLSALEALKRNPGVRAYNLGTGQGYSVLQVIHAFEKASEKSVPYNIVARRSGDIAACYADPTRANDELGWSAQRDLEQMCRDTWNWQSKNPNGYKD